MPVIYFSLESEKLRGAHKVQAKADWRHREPFSLQQYKGFLIISYICTLQPQCLPQVVRVLGHDYNSGGQQIIYKKGQGFSPSHAGDKLVWATREPLQLIQTTISTFFGVLNFSLKNNPCSIFIKKWNKSLSFCLHSWRKLKIDKEVVSLLLIEKDKL